MAVINSTEDPVDIEKEADRTSAIANSVVDDLPNILNGTSKLSQTPEFSKLILTYALYGKIADNLKGKDVKLSNNLPTILRFLFPDLSQFLPPSIFYLTTQVRRYINKAQRLGHLKSLYQPVAKLYSAKHNLEWADFKKCGISQDLLLTGPLIPSSGSQMQLSNRHVILLLNLRNKHHLCWVKVVPQWLRYFGILQADDCVQLQDIKGHWVGLGLQADKLKGAQLHEFLNTPYTLPKSFVRKNIDPVSSSRNLKLPGVAQKKWLATYFKENQQKVDTLQKEVNELKSQMTKQDAQISDYQKKLSQSENKVEHLSTKLCKMRVMKNHWLMKYRSMSGINLFAEDFEFNANLSDVQKIRDGARYIKRILRLRCAEQSSGFLENFLDDSFIEELLESILAQGISFDKSSNVLSDILQELVKQSQKKLASNLEWYDSRNNPDPDSQSIHNKSVSHRNSTATTDDVLVISDSDQSGIEDNVEMKQSKNKTLTPSSHDKTGEQEIIDLCKENDSENPSGSMNAGVDTYCHPSNSSQSNQHKSSDNSSGTTNIDLDILGQLPNSSRTILKEYAKYLSSNVSLAGLFNEEEMLQNAYVLYETVSNKRTHDASEEPSKDLGHASREDPINYQPKTKMVRLERQKIVYVDDPDPEVLSEASLSPLFLEDEPCASPFALGDSYVVESKPSESARGTSPPPIDKPRDIDAELSKLQNKLRSLSDEYLGSSRPNFGDADNARFVPFDNTTRLESPPCLTLENPNYDLEKLEKPQGRIIGSSPSLILENPKVPQSLDEDKQVSQEESENSQNSPASAELVQDKNRSSSNVFDDTTNTNKKRAGRKPKTRRGRKKIT